MVFRLSERTTAAKQLGIEFVGALEIRGGRESMRDVGGRDVTLNGADDTRSLPPHNNRRSPYRSPASPQAAFDGFSCAFVTCASQSLHLSDHEQVPARHGSPLVILMKFTIGVAPGTRRIDKATLVTSLLLQLRARGG